MGEEQLYKNLATPEEITRKEREARVGELGDGFITLGVEERKARMWAGFLDEFSEGRMRLSTELRDQVEATLTVRDDLLFFYFGKDNFRVKRDCESGVTSIQFSQPLEQLRMRHDDGNSLFFALRDGYHIVVKDTGKRIKICSAPSGNLVWLDL